MTPDQLKKLYPNASRAFINRNTNSSTGLSTSNQESHERSTLVSTPQREETRWYGPARRFEIVFRVFSQRPCDYDGYSIKELQDMVVRAEIIPDDRWDVLAGRVISEKAGSKEEERTVIEIIPINPTQGDKLNEC